MSSTNKELGFQGWLYFVSKDKEQEGLEAVVRGARGTEPRYDQATELSFPPTSWFLPLFLSSNTSVLQSLMCLAPLVSALVLPGAPCQLFCTPWLCEMGPFPRTFHHQSLFGQKAPCSPPRTA